MTEEFSKKILLMVLVFYTLKMSKKVILVHTPVLLLTMKANVKYILKYQVIIVFYITFIYLILYFCTVGLPNAVVFKTNAMKEQESTTSYTLIWEVFSFAPIIEYSLLFREYAPNKDSMRYDWTKLTIPAEYSNSILHTMLYTIQGLKEKTKYEALLISRNKYGWSKPSPILRFATKGAGTASK